MPRPKAQATTLVKDPLWYKDAIVYEVHVRGFLDSNGDGIGDLPGLAQKLDYLQDLGVTAIWLLPFYPSPLKDDGYDIADYYSINPIYGTLKDFKALLNEAHRRNLRVITELVVNHTSDQHPWFQRSRRAAPGSTWRDFYVWSERPDKYKEARIIFRDFEPSNWTWDPVAQAYFWHRFYAHQPDLNYDNPQVHKEIGRALDFWLDLGVDGLRLDAVPYLYEREGTSCENLPETHQYLKKLRQHVDEKYGDRMLLAEANQWPEEAVTYFGSGKGDECHVAFHFPLMPRIFMAVRMEDRVPIVDILEQTPPIPETSQWALFLRNHDELTLEMVTDEERDYMYRVYANDARARLNLGIRRRLAPLLGNNRRRIELLYMLLLSLPGTPVLYYGDEIGMGDNVFLGDRNGVRTPMQWSSDKNAGFSRASPQALYFPIILDPEYHYEAVNVEAQQRNPSSLFWWLKRALTLRKRMRAFSRGSLEFLQPENRKILAFIRRLENEAVLVVVNLSRFSQPVRLDLSTWKQTTPIELFGRTEFPPISSEPYTLALSPHAVFWFSLEAKERGEPSSPDAVSAIPPQPLTVIADWTELLSEDAHSALETHLISYLKRNRFVERGREIKSARVRDAINLSKEKRNGQERLFLLVLQVEYQDADPQDFFLAITFATGEQRERLLRQDAHRVIASARITDRNIEGILVEALGSDSLCQRLGDLLMRRRSIGGREGELRASGAAALRSDRNGNVPFSPSRLKTEYANGSIVLNNKYFLKLFRRFEAGINPDLEVGRFLTERAFPNITPVAGWLEYHRHGGEQSTAGILTNFLPNAIEAWDYTRDMLSRYFDRVRSAPPESQPDALSGCSLLDLSERVGEFTVAQASRLPQEAVMPAMGAGETPALLSMIGTYVELARLLGQRTGELHLALAAEAADPAFAPEPFTPFYQRARFQSMRNLALQNLELLRRSLGQAPEAVRPLAEKVAALQPEIIKRLRALHAAPISARRIRCHGNFHLGEVLYTGKDFVFIDFEGEPSRPLGERRIKRSPVTDIVRMVRSFDYVAHAALLQQLELGTQHPEHLHQLEPWARFWARWAGAIYLRACLDTLANSDLLPANQEQLAILLDTHLLQNLLHEIRYELLNRPQWLKVPLEAMLGILGG
ncbi:MAG: maltose alpha-D-glucosyltransferase [Verrucomicrobia bacterium]|nr:MAG: maltose alpha-D-glucosyltransferase [Verrucomicrobiota bacterium]